MFARQLLAAMGAAPDVLAHASYARIVFGFNGVILMLFLLNAVFRGAGDAAIAMRVLWIANAINICLDPCLIFGLGPFPRLGVTGAAVATTTGRGIGVLIQLRLLLRPKADRAGIRGRIAIHPAHAGIEPAVMLNMIRLSGSAVLQALIVTTSWVALVRILASFGSAAVAAYTIVVRIVFFALLPAWGLANAAATLVGQNLGAGRPDRAERSVWQACRYNVVFFTAVGAVLLALAGPIAAAFSTDAAVEPVARGGLRIVSSGFLFYALGIVLTQSFNGAGDMWTPTAINLFSFWLLGVPIAHLLAHRVALDAAGVFLAITIADAVMAVASAVAFRRGRWKTKRV
jgi:putative MATE family efflux protein